jgi:hypothetical protein
MKIIFIFLIIKKKIKEIFFKNKKFLKKIKIYYFSNINIIFIYIFGNFKFFKILNINFLKNEILKKLITITLPWL